MKSLISFSYIWKLLSHVGSEMDTKMWTPNKPLLHSSHSWLFSFLSHSLYLQDSPPERTLRWVWKLSYMQNPFHTHSTCRVSPPYGLQWIWRYLLSLKLFPLLFTVSPPSWVKTKWTWGISLELNLKKHFPVSPHFRISLQCSPSSGHDGSSCQIPLHIPHLFRISFLYCWNTSKWPKAKSLTMHTIRVKLLFPCELNGVCKRWLPSKALTIFILFSPWENKLMSGNIWADQNRTNYVLWS